MPGIIGPEIERIWPALPIGIKIAALLLGGLVIFKWGIDNWRTPYHRPLGIFFMLAGTVMILASFGALWAGR
jgi:hypothetical protein